jgi:hypothetical protein
MNLNDTTSTTPDTRYLARLEGRIGYDVDLVILPAHDPGAAGRLAQATAPVTRPHVTQPSQ